MEEKKKSIFLNSYVITFLGLLVSYIIFRGLDLLKEEYFPNTELFWIVLSVLIILVIVLVLIDRWNRIEGKLNNIEEIVKNIEKMLK